MARSGPKKKVANSLVAMSSAAVMAVYAAGYHRTKTAADRFDTQALERRVAPQRAPAPAPAPTSVPAREAIVRSEPASEPKRAIARVSKQGAAPEPAAAPVEAAAVPAPIETIPEPPPVVAFPEPEVATVVIPPPPPPPPEPPKPTWKDGTYVGWGHVRHGDIEATVVIEGGRIKSAVISQCRTRYECDVIEKLPAQVPARQSPDVDSVSGATQSADAFFYAVTEALSKAK